MSGPTFQTEAPPSTRPLRIFGPVDLDMTPIRAAKAHLALPYKVMPVAQRTPAPSERVLAWGARPPFLCNYALVTDRTALEPLAHALAWVLHEREDDRAMTTLDMLQVAFGIGVREIPPEELRSEQALRDYQKGER